MFLEAGFNQIFYRWYIDVNRLDIKEEARDKKSERKSLKLKEYYKRAYWSKVSTLHPYQSIQ